VGKEKRGGLRVKGGKVKKERVKSGKRKKWEG
jgi:hypothetical protein